MNPKYDNVKSSYAQDALGPVSPQSNSSKAVPKYEKETYKGESQYAQDKIGKSHLPSKSPKQIPRYSRAYFDKVQSMYSGENRENMSNTMEASPLKRKFKKIPKYSKERYDHVKGKGYRKVSNKSESLSKERS